MALSKHPVHGINLLQVFCSTSDSVDDILIAGNNRALIDEVKGYIEFHFKIKDMGPVKTMLNNNICHNVQDGLLTMDQSIMIKKIVEEF